MARVGWHCLACNRYFQTSDRSPRRCRYCGRAGPLRRIGHRRPVRGAAVATSVGDTVTFETTGETRTYVVGRVVGTEPDGLVVRARDGTGLYTVPLDRVVRVRGN